MFGFLCPREYQVSEHSASGRLGRCAITKGNQMIVANKTLPLLVLAKNF